MGGALRIGALGAVLLLVAAALDAEPLYVPGVALLLLAGGAAAWVLGAARGLAVTRTIATSTVHEDQEVPVRIQVRAPALLMPAGMLHDPLLATPTPVPTASGASDVRVTARFPRRGRHQLAAPRVVVRDPFGLAVREVTGVSQELLVLPKVLPVLRAGGGGAGDAIGHRPTRSRVAAEVELDGLRPLRSGTSAARISWAVWARTGDLYERHLRPDGDDRPVVVLDTRTMESAGGAGGADGEHALDAAVRAAASLCVHLARRGGCSLLLPGDRHPVALDPGLTAWPRQHVRLALVRAGGTPAAGALTGRTGVIFYVSAQPLTGAPRALAHTTGRGRMLVVPTPVRGRAAAFEVAGCLGYDLAPRTARRGTAA
jgi:uncharacterized protein (DUF58 family)